MKRPSAREQRGQLYNQSRTEPKELSSDLGWIMLSAAFDRVRDIASLDFLSGRQFLLDAIAGGHVSASGLAPPKSRWRSPIPRAASTAGWEMSVNQLRVPLGATVSEFGDVQCSWPTLKAHLAAASYMPVEVSNADPQRASIELETKFGRPPKQAAVLRAAAALWPDKIRPNLQRDQIHEMIVAHLKSSGENGASPTTTDRALKEFWKNPLDEN